MSQGLKDSKRKEKSQSEFKQDYSKVPTKELIKDSEKEFPKEYGYGVRHVQLVIFLLCLAISFIVRAHIGVTIVAMTTIGHQNTHLTNIENITVVNVNMKIDKENFTELAKDKYFNQTKLVDIGVENNTEKQLNKFETYNWSKPIQEMVLTSFFLGYCIMTLPIGIITQRWGGKLPLQISLFINGVASIVTPWMAVWGGWKAVCFCRIVQGLAQAGTFPAIQTLLAKWVPSNERGTLSSYVYTGATIGTVIAFQLSGMLADSRWGWPSIFWAIGAICLFGFVILTIFGSRSPSEHNYISYEEKNYILGFIVNDKSNQKKTVPWKAILTSKPVWACFATQAGSGLGMVFLLTQVPTYIHYILGIDVKSSGLLSSLPYVASFFASVSFGLISDFCTNRGIVTVRNARRISNSFSQVTVALCLILVSFASNITFVVVCLIVGTSCQMAINTGWLVNHIDLAPNYAGTIISYGNVIMNSFVLIFPVLVSQIVIDVRNQHQWQIMFGLTAGVALVCNTLFVIFMSSDTQPWNDFTEDIPMDGIKPNKDAK